MFILRTKTTNFNKMNGLFGLSIILSVCLIFVYATENVNFSYYFTEFQEAIEVAFLIWYFINNVEE